VAKRVIIQMMRSRLAGSVLRVVHDGFHALEAAADLDRAEAERGADTGDDGHDGEAVDA
jgi:hypothetical protein